MPVLCYKPTHILLEPAEVWKLRLMRLGTTKEDALNLEHCYINRVKVGPRSWDIYQLHVFETLADINGLTLDMEGHYIVVLSNNSVYKIHIMDKATCCISPTDWQVLWVDDDKVFCEFGKSQLDVPSFKRLKEYVAAITKDINAKSCGETLPTVLVDEVPWCSTI